MQEQPLVSVIIPVFNVERYLKQCLDSVLNQTLKDIEVICVDDGSTDKSLRILNEYKQKDKRIILLKQKNLYAGVARNNGLKVAKGKYLSFLDSDDIFVSTMLEDMYKKAEEDQSDVVICTFFDYNTLTKKSIFKRKINQRFIDMSPFKPEEAGKDLFDFSSLNAWTKLFRHNLFTENDLHFESTQCCNDLTCVCTALAIAKKISIINKPYIYYRMKQTNNLTAGRNKHVESFLTAAQCLENNLKHFDVYDKFKDAFASKMQASFKWENSLCSTKQKDDRKQLAKKILSDNLYFILYNQHKK